MPKRHEEEEHEEHENHEAWVIPYADMLTLLMAMFLMLYAVGTIDAKKFQALAGAFRSEILGKTTVVDPGISSDDGSGIMNGTTSAWPISELMGALTDRQERMDAIDALHDQEATQQAEAAEAQQLDQAAEQIKTEVEALGLGGTVSFERNERGLLITVLSDQVLFSAGAADLAPKSSLLLDELIRVLQPLPNALEVVGHTDATPIHTAQYPSNWELSTQRSGSVVRYFIDRLGFPASRLRASGLADTQPIDTNATPEGRARNRRVEITVLTAVGTELSPATAAAADAAGVEVAPTASEPTTTTGEHVADATTPVAGGTDHTATEDHSGAGTTDQHTTTEPDHEAVAAH